MASIPTPYFKTFFSVRRVLERYPRLTYELAQSKKNHFCNLALHYLAILQGYLKHYDINEAIQLTISYIEQQQTHDHYYQEFYFAVIQEIRFCKQVHDRNHVPGVFHGFIRLLYDYVRRHYQSD